MTQLVRTISYRPFTPEDHEVVSSWWKDWDWTPVPLPSLPKNGVIIEVGGVPRAAGWIYKTDSDIAWLEWVIADKKAHKIDRDRALEALITKLCQIAHDLGFKVMFSSSQRTKLGERLERHHFTQTDTGMNFYIRRF